MPIKPARSAEYFLLADKPWSYRRLGNLFHVFTSRHEPGEKSTENNNIKNNCKGMRYLSFLHANVILLKRQCFRLFLNSGQLKNLFHALPLLIRGSTRFTLLEFVYKGFPFGLPLQCRQSAESTIPVKVGRSFHNHKQTVSQ